MYKNIDKENMYKAIWEFPDNLKDSLELGNQISINQNYKDIKSVLIAGMGGSAIGGNVVSILEEKNINVPLFVCRGYDLPNWVNENTLVICSSYSGNTEETLAALDNALNNNAQVCGFTTGGELAIKLNSLNKDVVIIPSGLQPRAALAFSFVPMIKILEKIGIINTEIDSWLPITINSLIKNRKLYSADSIENPTFRLAEKIYDKIPIIYSNLTTLGIAAMRLKGQICENGKMLCYYNDLPELNHNEVVGWENNEKIFKYLAVLWLNDINDNSRIKHRQDITKRLLNKVGIEQFEIEMKENLFQDRFLNMIHYGDWLSFWCAIKHSTDPSPVENISILKKELMKRR